MNLNMGRIDRVLRLIVAAGAVVGSGILGFSTGWGIVLLIVAVVMLATSASGYCPLYSLFGIDTTGDADSTTNRHRTLHLHHRAI